MRCVLPLPTPALLPFPAAQSAFALLPLPLRFALPHDSPPPRRNVLVSCRLSLRLFVRFVLRRFQHADTTSFRFASTFVRCSYLRFVALALRRATFRACRTRAALLMSLCLARAYHMISLVVPFSPRRCLPHFFALPTFYRFCVWAAFLFVATFFCSALFPHYALPVTYLLLLRTFYVSNVRLPLPFSRFVFIASSRYVLVCSRLRPTHCLASRPVFALPLSPRLSVPALRFRLFSAFVLLFLPTFVVSGTFQRRNGLPVLGVSTRGTCFLRAVPVGLCAVVPAFVVP